nr:hypothetical protein Iba_chr06fCG8930 [Ipomoea batatas]
MRTPGFSGADLTDLLNEAAIPVVLPNQRSLQITSCTSGHLGLSKDNFLCGPSPEPSNNSRKELLFRDQDEMDVLPGLSAGRYGCLVQEALLLPLRLCFPKSVRGVLIPVSPPPHQKMPSTMRSRRNSSGKTHSTLLLQFYKPLTNANESEPEVVVEKLCIPWY